MSSSVHVIAVQFGPMPSTFPLWAKSAARNVGIRFHLFTDQDCEDGLPGNVLVHRTTLDLMRDRISRALGVEISMPRPYKICDYRPMFGVIFADELQDAKFWGHCDLDVMFGDLDGFLTAEVTRFDKILVRGNFSLYRNNEVMRNMFRRSIPGVDWRQVVATDDNMLFDEWAGIYKILLANKIAIYNEPVISDIKVKSYAAISNDLPKHRHELNVWRDGKIIRHVFGAADAQPLATEKILVHLQKRPYRAPSGADLEANHLAFGPDRVIALPPDFQVDRSAAFRLNRPSVALDIAVHMRRAALKVKKQLKQLA